MQTLDLDESLFSAAVRDCAGPGVPTFQDLWQAFLSLCEEPLADGDDDLLLYETWTSEDGLVVAFTRQVILRAEDGRSEGMHHLTCECRFAQRGFDDREQQIWGRPGPRLMRRWEQEIEATRGFIALTSSNEIPTYVASSGVG